MELRLKGERRPKVIGAGLVALDIVLGREGTLLSHGTGGSAGNVLSILAKLGWNIAPLGEVGRDLAGELISQELAALDADLRYLRKSAALHTPVVYQHQLPHDSGKTHEFSFSCPRCGERTSAGICSTMHLGADDFDHLTADVFYFDRATETAVQLAEYHQHRGVLIVFEPSKVGDNPAIFERALSVAHIIKYADDRLAELRPAQTSNVAVEICTMGAKGLRFKLRPRGSRWIQLEAFHVTNVIDTSGAGDWCTSGMLYALFNNAASFDIFAADYGQITRALTFGQALSALNCLTIGARGLASTFSANDIIGQAMDLARGRMSCHATHEIPTNSPTPPFRLPEANGHDCSNLGDPADTEKLDGICCGAWM